MLEDNKIGDWLLKCRLLRLLQVKLSQIGPFSLDLTDEEIEEVIKAKSAFVDVVKLVKRSSTPIKTVKIVFEGALTNCVYLAMHRFSVSLFIDKV